MAMTSWPFTSQNTGTTSAPVWDRAVGSGVLRNIFTQFFGNGVFPNPSTNFQVVQDTGMQVKVKSGSCTINGATAFENTDRILVVQAADTNDRIDTVVLRLNDNNAYRNIDLYIVKGTAASVPEAPALTRTSSIHELGIANLYISANSSTISQERIADTRLDTTRCGYSMPIQEIDTSALYTQIQSDLVAFQGVNEADFTAWFNEMKDQLSTDAAGNLQSEIGILSDLATAAKENIVSAINEVKQDVSDAIEELNNNLPIYNAETDALDIYSNGVLVGSLPCSFQTLYLYKDGVVNTAAIGGFTPYAYAASGDKHETMKALSIAYNAASMRVSAPAVSSGYNHVGTMFNNLPVNLDGKTNLYIDFDYLYIPSGGAESYIKVGVTSSVADNYTVLASVKKTASTTTPSTLVIPVSSIASNCYVFVELLGWDKAAVPYIDISKIYVQ